MEEYKTKNGNTLYYKVVYDLGGSSYFTSQTRERGYYLIIQRCYNTFAVFDDITKPQGANKLCLFTTKRKSAKYLERAKELAVPRLERFLEQLEQAGYTL